MTTLEKILQEIEAIKVGVNTECRYKCKLYDWTVGACMGDCETYVKEQVKEIIKKHMVGEERTENAIPSRNDNKWMPCDPENIPDTEVLCCDEYGEELIGYLSNTAEGWVCESDECIMYYVVAWMPKPEPYRKDGE